MGEILGRKCSFNIYVHNVQLNWVNGESRDLRWRCGCLFTFVSASRGHLCDSTAFSTSLCFVATLLNSKVYERDSVDRERHFNTETFWYRWIDYASAFSFISEPVGMAQSQNVQVEKWPNFGSSVSVYCHPVPSDVARKMTKTWAWKGDQGPRTVVKWRKTMSIVACYLETVWGRFALSE